MEWSTINILITGFLLKTFTISKIIVALLKLTYFEIADQKVFEDTWVGLNLRFG